MSKILAVNGSPRADGNTAHMLRAVLAILEELGHETEFYQAGGRPVTGCLGCNACFRDKGTCVTKDWVLEELYPKLLAADAIVIGSPTYFANVTTEIKAVIDRVGVIARRGGFLFARKVGAGVTAARRAGGLHTVDAINHLFLNNDMVVAGSIYWNLGIAKEPGEYEGDAEGVSTMEHLAQNIHRLLR